MAKRTRDERIAAGLKAFAASGVTAEEFRARAERAFGVVPKTVTVSYETDSCPRCGLLRCEWNLGVGKQHRMLP